MIKDENATVYSFYQGLLCPWYNMKATSVKKIKIISDLLDQRLIPEQIIQAWGVFDFCFVSVYYFSLQKLWKLDNQPSVC